MGNEVVNNTKLNALKTKVNKLEKQTPDSTNLIHINQCDAGRHDLKKEIGNTDKKLLDTSGLVTTTVLNTKNSKVEHKIPATSSLVTATVLNRKSGEIENKSLDHSKYITAEKFNKIAAENFASRLKQANVVGKTDLIRN